MKKYIGYGWGKLGVLVAMLAIAILLPAGLSAQDAAEAQVVETLATAETVEEEAPVLDSGNTAWMITATILVLFMSIPGIALFYGGLVRQKNVSSDQATLFT